MILESISCNSETTRRHSYAFSSSLFITNGNLLVMRAGMSHTTEREIVYSSQYTYFLGVIKYRATCTMSDVSAEFGWQKSRVHYFETCYPIPWSM